jgi:hypothetical protein
VAVQAEDKIIFAFRRIHDKRQQQSISKSGLSSFRLVSPLLVALVEVTFALITFPKSGFLALFYDRDLSFILEQVLLSFSGRITYDVESAQRAILDRPTR